MGEIIELSKKRQERVSKLSAEKILERYWNKKDVPVDIIKIAKNIKEFTFYLTPLDTSLDREHLKFFASISKINGVYHLHYKAGMLHKKLRLVVSFALSYITHGLVDKATDQIMYIDERLTREEDPVREHEKEALLFAQNVLMPLDSIIKILDVLKKQNIESTVGNIAHHLEVMNITIVSNRLIELQYLK